ncbi:MAG: S-layer domain protein [Candidatus Peregrinibacteria bacterium GW2011_GWA2_44_7]|nr:MAG: S-layer domain protein [Candidatus Peregrinibacteria bacterium GW2011_GWA2_44_7]
MKKYLISLVLISTLLFPWQVLAATFPDVSSSHNNFMGIEYLVEIGTLKGYDDGTFRPEGTVNRAELMKIMVAGQGLDPDAGLYNNCFPDIKDDWYAKYVCFGKTMGWVGGYPDGSFKPENTVSKVEAAKILINSLGLSSNLSTTVTEKKIYFACWC